MTGTALQTRTLFTLLMINVAASIAHYADNILRFVVYPEPPWLNPSRVDLFWFVMTPLGFAAYALYRRGKERSALVTSFAYGMMNLLVLGHYLIEPPWRLPFEINALILLEALAAVAWLAYTTRLHMSLRNRKAPLISGPSVHS